MKKVVSLLISAILLVSLTITSFAAPTYGSEWEGYYHNATTRYSDVPSTHWAYDAIMRSTEKNWFGGYPDGTFRPDGSITRAEALKVFVVFLGLELKDVKESSFYDVSPSKWYAPYIEAGKELFPTHTTVQGKRPFNPEMPVTREDTIYALVKALGYNVGVKYVDESILNMFSDKNSISGDIKSYFAIALNNQLVSGFPDGTIRAQDSLTRAEFATLLYRGSFVGFNDSYEAYIETVAVTPTTSIEMTIGETVELSARATYTDNSNKPYTELSPYDANGNGVVSLKGTTITAVKEGTAVIKYNDSYLKNEALTITVKKPTDTPVIKVTDYEEITEEETMTIKGKVTDKSGSVDLTCNGKDVSVNKDGSFKTTVSLKVGTNNITFVATNIYGLETTKSIAIEREKAEEVVVPEKEEVKEEEEEKETEKVTEEKKKVTCNFYDMDTELDTSWGDDEFFFYFSFVCDADVVEYGIEIWDAESGKEIDYLDAEKIRKDIPAGTIAGYSGCHGSIFEDSIHNLVLGRSYKWVGYAIDADGKKHESKIQEFVFDGEGSRFLD